MSSSKSTLIQKYIDAQLLNIKSMRIRYPTMDSKISKSQSIDINLNTVRLAQLQNALRLCANELPIACHCAGTVSIELIGELLPNLVLTFHLHRNIHSLWLPESSAGTRLLDGKPILRLLYECGVRGPLEAVIEAFKDQTKRGPTLAMMAKLQQLVEQLPPDTKAQLTPNQPEPALTSSKQGKSTK
jgi:hypothetical protein